MKKRVKMRTSTCVIGMAALGSGLLLAGSALAQSKPAAPRGPDAERGLALSEQLCRNCHIVSPRQSSSAGAGIPSFRVIANKPDQTGTRIVNVLIKPHAPMPNMQLSRFEILDIIAYLDRLRSADAGPPLLKPAKKGRKLSVPSPS